MDLNSQWETGARISECPQEMTREYNPKNDSPDKRVTYDLWKHLYTEETSLINFTGSCRK